MVQKYFLVPNYIKVLALLPKAEIYFDLVALTLFVALIQDSDQKRKQSAKSSVIAILNAFSRKIHTVNYSQG